jgi:lipoprotein-releasing system permease protein
VEIKAADVEMAPAVSATVANNLGEGGFRTRDWQELNRGLFGALALEKLAMFVALGIAILVAGFCVFGTLTLMVQEKQREVGVLKSMGVSRKEIVRIFMLEGAMIGIFGSLIGLGLGFVVGFAAENFGIRMDPQVYYIDRLPVQMDSLEFLWVGLTSAIVSLLATIVPAVLASRMQPVEALRHD